MFCYRSSVVVPVALGLVLALSGRAASAQDLYISEFMAVNDSTIRDEDGDASDWLEVYNDGPQAVNLDGYFLTDDRLEPNKWRFPSVSIPPEGFVVVFASDKDRRAAGSELHTNFRLSSAGEYLALIAPDGSTVVHEYDVFPPQVGDFSYGLSQNGTFFSFIEEGDPARALVPTSGALGTAWTSPDFDDSGWIAGRTGAGYDENSDYLSIIRLDLGPTMQGSNTTAYLRVPFEVDDPTGVSGFVLRVKYDDGFVAYLNGQRVASANAPSSVDWDASASGLHDDALAQQFEEFPFTAAGVLRAGTNVLAIHGLNDNLSSSDFVIAPELSASSSGDLDADQVLYFPVATPGAGNVRGYPGISETPRFTVTGGVFSGSVQVGLEVDSANATIRYTTDGSEPGESSPVASGAITVSQSALVRARSFQPDFAPSPIRTEGFVEVQSSVASFDSDLPIVLIENFGGGQPGQNSHQPMFLAIYEPGPDGRTRLTTDPVLQTRGGIRIRGSSTAGQPKKQYAVEAWDEKGEQRSIEPFGMPGEADWILYGGNSFDQTSFRNAFIFQKSREIGVWAPRTHFCEVYFNEGGGSISSSDYIGVYALTEKIDRDEDRVDVQRLDASDDSEPDITGGYMFKIDRLDPGDGGFSAGGQRMGWVYPKEELVTPAQRSWLTNYINQFISALNGSNFRDPVNGYRRYIDDELWIDHHVLNVLACNVDALRLSTYFYKRREEPIVAGPIWDFDRSMGSTDGRDDNPRAWNGTGDGTQFFRYPWWDRLFDDIDFDQLWVDHWHDYRRGTLSNSSLTGLVDSMRIEIAEAAERNHQRWGWGSFSSDVSAMRSWLVTRANWIDDQFVDPPTVSAPGREIAPGFEVSLSGDGSIYYTLDGTDPRARGGSPASGATLYDGEPITLTENVRLVARARSGSATAADGPRTNWSGTTDHTYWVAPPPLVISEIMFHPPEPLLDAGFDDDDFEYVEFLNVGAEPLDLEGFRVTGAIRFEFGPGDLLPPGEYVVIVENEEAFGTRYDATGIRVAGQYEGNLDNSEETIYLEGPLLEPIHAFEYSDTWYPDTDGLGLSLIVVDPYSPLSTWPEPSSWAPSSDVFGNPGYDDSGVSGLGGRQRPGDSNQDGSLDLSDGIHLLQRLFVGGIDLPCDGGAIDAGGNLAVLDVDGDETVNLTDAVHLMSYLFTDGPEPAMGTRCVRVEGCPSTCAGI